ncbi:DUF368 domain-containing protein [Exilibacterium tricleocarpae]|uniref:DUF368 domain-containing protein n=2 Tax=Exilibacterium tricleocarpae TaxID=2591008 RepID=A0A545U5S2_9GAMM|nr:DUF368 domain-containing protein [Exilibacterium tricleocarpae]
MGAADVVPGVSGGTIAFISGIYSELIDSLRSINLEALQTLRRRGIGACWQVINGNFLLALFTGIAISLVTLARVINYCLTHYPIHVWSFFFGLILASIFYMVRQTGAWHRRELLALVLGTGIALAISMAKPAALPGEWWMALLAGSVAICAMILPGISGSFILLLMGMYSAILRAIEDLDWLLLASFGVGCACGLLAFSHVLSWLLRRFYTLTLSFLTGFLVGSLNIIWPWKQTLQTTLNRHGEEVPLVQSNLWPATYSELTGLAAHTGWALMLALLGMVVVLGFERLAGGENRQSKDL